MGGTMERVHCLVGVGILLYVLGHAVDLQELQAVGEGALTDISGDSVVNGLGAAAAAFEDITLAAALEMTAKDAAQPHKPQHLCSILSEDFRKGGKGTHNA